MDIISDLSKLNLSEKELLTLVNKEKTAAKKNVAPDIFASTFIIDEHTINNKLVGRVTAFDLNNQDNLSYSIVSGNTQDAFKIDNLGNITVADSSKLNYESKSIYTLSVRVSDGQKTDTARITINLNNLNDAPDAKDDNAQVLQDRSVVIKVLANDKDQDKDSLSLSSVGKPAHGNVVLNADGTVTYKPNAGFSGADSFTYTVTDGKETSTATVNVNVKPGPVNTAPKVDDSTLDIAENSAKGTVVGKVVATDAENNKLSYKITKGNEDGVFSIDSKGDIHVANSAKLNYEQKNLHSLTVEVSDGKLVSAATVKINVSNVNEAPVLNDVTLKVEENAAAGTVVGTLKATDVDSNALTCKIVSGNENGLFQIDNAGQITVAQGANLDYETKSAYSLIVETSDGALTDTATVKINVSNVNEAPVLNDTTLDVAEKSAAGTVVGKLVATDPDGNKLTYKILSGNESGAFKIDNNGQITVVKSTALNNATNPVHTLVVQTSDGKLVDTATVKINVSKVNEAPVLNDATLNVAENSVAGTVVGKLAATDANGDALTYKIVSGNEAGLFKIDNAGQITLAQGANLDYEAKAAHTLVVETSDGKLADTATIKINIGNVNEAPVLNDATLNVAENSAAGTVVGKVTATDVDGDTVTYKIVSGNESGFFAMNNNGQITVAQGAHLDYETKNAYTLSVEASDGKLVDTANVKINIGDVNEGPVVNPNPDPTPTGTVYEIGKAGSPYQNLSDINWNSLHGGDVVKIYWKPEAYAERVLLSASGEEGNPIIIEGVKGPNGELPVITAENATTDDQFANFSIWRQDLGGSFYIGTPNSVGNGDAQPGFITIRGLELTGAGQGKTFTDALGRVSEEQGQPAVYVKGATNITIEDNYMHHNGMGVFSNSNHDFEVVENLVVRGNTFEDNGVVGSFLSHHVYTEGIDTVIDGNTFLEKIDGDYGSLLKMRDVGVTITNNYFGNTYTHAIDLGDVQGDALNNLGLANSDKFHNDNLIASNKFVSEGGGIYLGGDSLGKDTGGGEGSGLYRESVSVVSNIFEYSIALENYWNFGLFRAPSGDQTFNLENNVIDIKINDTNPYYDPTVGLMADSGTVNLIGENWISSDTQEGSGRSTGNVVGWNSPTTHHVTGDIDITPPGYGNVDEPTTPTPNPNVNHAPVLNDATLTVAENSVAGTIVGKVTATDPDGNPLTYKIVSGNDNGFFSIDNNGQIKVVQGANLDYETKTSHTLVVETSDGSLKDTANVKINISDVNETTNPGTDPGTNPNPTVGTVYEIGKAGSQYQNLSDINWNSLKGGDVVKIYWKPEAYAERIILNAKGEDGNPIIIEGVKGPNGELPVLTAANATTDDQFDSFSAGRQNLGGIFSLGAPSVGAPGNGYPENITIRGLELTGSGQGNSFTNSHGQVDNEQGQSAIYVKGGKNIVIEDNYIHDNGMGVFSNSNHDNEIVENLIVRGNTFENNGEVGSYFYHHVYTEGINTLIDGNTFLSLKDGSEGGLLKMRDVGITVTNNYFGNVQTGAIDIVDVQANGLVGLGLADSDKFHNDNLISGNHFVSTGGVIYFGGDSLGKDMGAGEGSGFYRESVDIVSNVFEYSIELKDYWRFGLFRAPSNDQTFNLENNIIDIKINDTNPYYKPLVALMADQGTINLIGSNWINSETEQGTDRATGTVNGWNSADTHHVIPEHMVMGTNSDDVLAGTSGNDIIFGGLGNDTLTGGAGEDLFFLMAKNGNDRIMDFNKNEDHLDISTILSNTHPLDGLLSEYVMLTKNGADTVVSIDTDGGGDHFTNVATLVGVNNLSAGAHATEAELTALVANGTLIA